MAIYDPPRKGKLIHRSGVEIEAHLVSESPLGHFSVLFVEGASPNSFSPREGWSFSPDVPPMPTKPGFYVRAGFIRENGAVSEWGDVLYLRANGTWTFAKGPLAESSDAKTFAERHMLGEPELQLVRVDFHKAEVKS